ncbi:hypothetical protein [Pseudomonas sp. S2_B03]
MPWYKTGTVSVTQNSNAVIGTGTAFIANSRVGDAFRGPDGGWYEVTNIASDTALSISPNYQGSTNASGVYALAPMQGYVKDSADALRALVNQFGGVLAVLGETPTQTGVRQALNLATADGLPEGQTNKYATPATVRGITLTGLDLTVKTPVVSTDTILAALGKLQAGKAAAGANTDITELNGLTKAVTAAQGGVSAGYIEGLIPQWNSATSITVSPGTAYIPGAQEPMVAASPLTLSGLSLTANTWYYLYLYDNAGVTAVELVTTAPAAPYSGTARTKTANTSRRFICALKTGSSGLLSFLWMGDTIQYMENFTDAPFRVLLGGPATTPTTTDLSAVVPLTTRTALLIATGNPGSIDFDIYFSTPEVQPKILQAANGSTGRLRSAMRLATSPTQQITRWVTAGSLTLDVYGYGNDR